MPEPQDIQYMQRALALAQAQLGRTWPNPSVGVVVVKDGVVVGEGATARGGRPHAETLALAQAGGKAKGATLYVSLEPCSHHGKTPPCAEAIIKTGISRVVAACTDPNPKVAGRGFAMLRAAGIEVTEKICEAEARTLNEGFFSVMERGRPFVALKIATSLDGKITTGDPDNKWITGEQSRLKVHELRAVHDAIMTGIGTVLADDPQLNCRLSGREMDSPQRVVMDPQLQIPLTAKVLPAWIVTAEAMIDSATADTLKADGNLLIPVTAMDDRLSLPETLAALVEQGITRLFVETGGTLAGAFIAEGLVDSFYWFRAPTPIGEKGMAALKGQDILAFPKRPDFTLKSTGRFGEDTLEIYDFLKTTDH